MTTERRYDHASHYQESFVCCCSSGTRAGLIPATAAAQNTFTVYNESHYQIYQLFVSPSNSNYWGSDRLGNRVFLPGYRFDLPVAYGWYDVKLVDKSGHSCVVEGVDFRAGGTWTITDDVLAVCYLLSAN